MIFVLELKAGGSVTSSAQGCVEPEFSLRVVLAGGGGESNPAIGHRGRLALGDFCANGSAQR